MATRRTYLLLVMLLAAGGLWTWLTRLPFDSLAQAERIAAPRAGFTAPELSLQTAGGETYSLASLKGKVVVLNFWATWCPPCRAEMTALDEVYRARRDAGLVVLAVDMQEDPAAVTGFMQEFGLTFPAVLDSSGAAAMRYGIHSLPSTFFIDRQGIVRDVVFGGPMSRALIESKTNTLLVRKGD